MKDKNKINHPYYTEAVDKTQSNLSENKENHHKTGFYQNSETFPPRGSFINIPEDILFGPNAKSLDHIIDDKNENIGSDLYNKK